MNSAVRNPHSSAADTAQDFRDAPSALSWMVLLRPKILAIKHGLLRPEKNALGKFLIMGALAGGFWVLTFWLFQRILGHFRGAEIFGDFLAARLLAMILLTFFSILLFSNILSSLSSCYLAKDLALILPCPVSVNQIFYPRLIETMVHSSWMVLLFGLPVFFVYGRVYHVSAGYYLVFLAALIPFLIIPASLGTLLSTWMVSLFPARRTRDILFLLFLLFGVCLYLLFRFLQPEKLVRPESFSGLTEYLTAMRAPSWPFLPSFWMAESILPYCQARAGEPVFFLGLLWSTAGAMTVLANWSFRCLFSRGWNKAQAGRRVSSSISAFFDLHRLLRPLHPCLRAMAIKDMKSFFRDTSQWSQLILLGALILVYLYNFSVLPLDKTPLPTFFLKNLISFLNLGLAGFVLAAVAGRFVFPAVSLEGFSIWIVRSAPISARAFLWAKFWTTLLPLLVLAETLILLSNWVLRVTPFMTVLSAFTIFFMTFGIVGLGIGMGAICPHFKFENADQVFTGFGGISFMIVSMAFIGAVVLLEAWPVYTIFTAGMKNRGLTAWETAGSGLSFGAAAVLIFTAAILPMRTGIRKMEEMDF